MRHSHHKFLDFVKHHWNNNIAEGVHPFRTLQNKLKNLKEALRVWNWEIFGDLNQAKDAATALVEKMQALFDDSPTKENRIQLQQANAHMFSILDREEIFWYQKSRVNWLTYGDRNTSFFHHYTRVRRQQNYVRRLQLN